MISQDADGVPARSGPSRGQKDRPMTHHEATIEITLAGETRTVAFHYYVFEDGSTSYGRTRPVFTGQIGRGTKAHQCSASLHRFDTPTEALRMGYRPGHTYRRASNGLWYGIKMGDVVLNRQCRITGWVDVQPHSSRHIMESASHANEG